VTAPYTKPGGASATPASTSPHVGTEPAEATDYALTGPDPTDRAAKGAAVASGVLIVSTLMPWVSVTFFNSSSLAGVRVVEGRITIILAFLAVVLSLTALVMEDNRRMMLLGSAIFGAGSLIATIVFSFRFHDAFSIPVALGGQEATALADAGIGLDSGWYLAVASSIALVGIGVFGYLMGRPKAAVPNLTWVDPQP
jgi:hypothetical protein